MKTAEAWSEELRGETSPELIRQIQADALAHALTLMGRGNWTGREAISHALDVLTRNPNKSGAAQEYCK
jgi:hypothetical protein